MGLLCVNIYQEIISYFSKIELGMAALFAFDWFLNLFIADHRMEQFLRCRAKSLFSFDDLLVVSLLLWI